MPKGVVYIYINKVNGMMYVGQTINERRRRNQHLAASRSTHSRNSGQPFIQALKKYGISNFEYIRLFITKDIGDIPKLKKILEQLEIAYIEFYDSINKGYNLTRGGTGMKGYSLPESSRLLIREKHIGKPLSLETRIKQSITQKIIQNRKETKERKSLLMSGKNNPMYDVHLNGELNHNFGKKLSLVTKEKISKARRGKGHSVSEETKKKISIANKGKIKSVEHREKLSAAIRGKVIEEKRKPILQYDIDGKFLKEWACITDAQKELSIVHISECCMNKRNHAGGYLWKYKSDTFANTVCKKQAKSLKSITQYDISGNFIKEWESIKDASEKLNISRSCISEVLYCRQYSTKGFIFKFTIDEKEKTQR